MITLPMPAIVNKYNKNMGGIDLLDSYLAKYRFLMRSRRWYTYLFWNGIMVGIVNAWIQYRRDCQSFGLSKKEMLTRRRFQSMVATSLTQVCKAKSRGRPSAGGDELQPVRKRAKAAPCGDIRRDSYAHWPVFTEKRGRCKLCAEGQTSISCEKCDVRLCLNKDRNCFKVFHN